MADWIIIAAWVLAIVWPLLVFFILWRGVIRGRGPNAFGWVFILIVSTAWGLGVWGVLWEPETLVVRRIEIVSSTWRGPPVKIGVIADIHSGAPHMSTRRLKRIVSRLNSQNPDVVALLGDYIGGHDLAKDRTDAENQRAMAAFPPLGELRAPLGVYAVLGNHDWWYDGKAVADALNNQRITVLQNQAALIRRPEGSFWIGGLSDYASKRNLPSFIDTLAQVPADDPVVVMSHWPDAFAVTPDRVSLVLAGHSHCGQVNLPYFGRLIHASEGSEKWQCGLYEERGRRLYVTAGVGVSIIPVRFRQPPEIAVITLRRE